MISNIEGKIKDALQQVFLEGMADGGTGGAMDEVVREFTGVMSSLAKEEAVALADKIIGKQIKVLYEHKDINDEISYAEPGTYSVNIFQREQRFNLAKYQEGLKRCSR